LASQQSTDKAHRLQAGVLLARDAGRAVMFDR